MHRDALSSTFCNAVGTMLSSCPSFLLQPRSQIVVSATSKNAEPEGQFNAIDDNTQNIKLGLEKDRDQRSQVTQSVDKAKGKGDASDRPVSVDIPIMCQDTTSKKDCCKYSH